jgi:hypothetical protein
MKKYEKCMSELFVYLSAGKLSPAEDPYQWFKRTVTMRVASDEEAIIYVDGGRGTLNLHRLGKIDDFVKDMCVFENNAARRRDILNFLREYRITPSHRVELREQPLEESKETGDSDDACIYVGMGISRAFSNVYATAYNEYVTILKEYMDTFKPEQVMIGTEPYTLIFTRRGFRAQLENIIRSAGQYIDDNTQLWYGHKEVVQYYMTRSLLLRGVLDSYLSSSEYLSMESFIKRFYRTSQIDRRLYFALPTVKNTPYTVTVDGRSMTVQEYIRSGLKENWIADQTWLLRDSIVRDFIETRKEDSLIANAIQEKLQRATTAIESYEKTLSKSEG